MKILKVVSCLVSSLGFEETANRSAIFSLTSSLLQSEHFPFIDCVETLVYEHKYPEWESCFETLGLDPKPIADCYSSGYGEEVGSLIQLHCPLKIWFCLLLQLFL